MSAARPDNGAALLARGTVELCLAAAESVRTRRKKVLAA
jgi:hypothetical protein